MPKYLVTAIATISLERTIEADTEELAIDECETDWDLHYDIVGVIEGLSAEEVSNA